VSEPIQIASHRGIYQVNFEAGDPFSSYPRAGDGPTAHVILDRQVASLYREDLAPLLDGRNVLEIEATEPAKSLERCPAYVEALVAGGLRRGHLLLAIGGGVIQDITCFLAAVVLRGLDWEFYPTTLLAQADSCIGSKSSINVGTLKNIVGTFTPPRRVVINSRVLRTLPEVEVRSGIGEMLKVHAIDGPASFDAIAADYPRLASDDDVMQARIGQSLRFKQRLIEVDEFDQGPRRVMNYGHSFGHAIESATDFGVPHGVAITVGMDMANFVAAGLGVTSQAQYHRMHPALAANYRGFERLPIPLGPLLTALGKDKKNTDDRLTLVLLDEQGRVGLVPCANDGRFQDLCAEYLASGRSR
jgi:3-dehydroquinate synthase